jgi:hypothetical protein
MSGFVSRSEQSSDLPRDHRENAEDTQGDIEIGKHRHPIDKIFNMRRKELGEMNKKPGKGNGHKIHRDTKDVAPDRPGEYLTAENRQVEQDGPEDITYRQTL